MSATSKAKQLRTTSTDSERVLWKLLRNRQLEDYKFRRQAPIGPYIVDFLCYEQRLIIELDGGHHAQQVDNDEQRTEYLESDGFRVIRFWNSQALAETESVLEAILEQLNAPSSQPSPTRGEGATSSPSGRGLR